MTDSDTIAELTKTLAKRDAQIVRLKKRLKTKMKYEKGLLQGCGAHPWHVIQIEQKDLAVLEE